MIRILVADEAELILVLQGSLLNRRECEVVTAGSADELLRKAAATRPDLALIDAAMDGSSGIDCCRRVKGDAALGSLPVVLVCEPGERAGGFAAGAEEVVCRPLSREQLSAALARRLGVSDRAGRRRPLSVRVDYFASRREGVAQTKDIGESGMFLKTRDAFHPGEELQMLFRLHVGAPSTIRASGPVVRAVPGHADSPLIPGIGVRFTELSARDRLEIATFVRSGGEAPP